MFVLDYLPEVTSVIHEGNVFFSIQAEKFSFHS